MLLGTSFQGLRGDIRGTRCQQLWMPEFECWLPGGAASFGQIVALFRRKHAPFGVYFILRIKRELTLRQPACPGKVVPARGCGRPGN